MLYLLHMGIEQQMEFDFSRGEKIVAAQKYNIPLTEEHLLKFEKNTDGEWEYNGVSAESLLAMYASNDNSDQYKVN